MCWTQNRRQTILGLALHTYLKKIQPEVTGSVLCPDDLKLVDVLHMNPPSDGS